MDSIAGDKMMMKNYLFLGLGLFLFSCGGSKTISSNINAKIEGLEGKLILQTNNGEKITITKNGTFDFKTQLVPGADYSLKVLEEPCKQRCTIDHPTGKISENGEIKISTNCDLKVWTFPKSIDDHISFSSSEVYAKYAASSMNNSGDTILTWSQFNKEGKDVIYKKEFRNREWKNPEDENDFVGFNNGGASWSTSSINSNGDSFISWSQRYTVDNYQVYLAQNLNDIWVYPSTVSDPISDKTTTITLDTTPSIVKSNDRGDVVVVWVQEDGKGNRHVYKADRRDGTWDYPDDLDDHLSVGSPGSSLGYLNATMNDNGITVVTWQQTNGDELQIFKSYYDEGWHLPVDVNDNISWDETSAFGPSVAINNVGDAIIAWHQQDALGYRQVYVARYHDHTWTSPSTRADNLSGDAENAFLPRVAINDSGHAIVTWYQETSNDVTQIFKSESQDSGKTWILESDPISPADTNATNPVIGIDNQENMLIVWMQEITKGAGPNVLIKAEFNPEKGWEFPTSIKQQISLDSGNAYTPDISMSECRKVIFWSQEDSNEKYQNYYADYR